MDREKAGRKRWRSKYITNDDSDDDESAINNGKLGVKLHRKNNVRGIGGWLVVCERDTSCRHIVFRPCVRSLARSQISNACNADVRTSECDTFNEGEFNYNENARCMAINGMN